MKIKILLIGTLLLLSAACKPVVESTESLTQEMVVSSTSPAVPPREKITPTQSPTKAASTTTTPTATVSATPALAASSTETTLGSGRAVSFETSDGVTLEGTLYGSGGTGILFLNMGDNRQSSWSAMAEQSAERGYLTLTFNYRYAENGNVTRNVAAHLTDDVYAALDFLHQQGAQQLMMAGASLGGMLAAKTASEAQAAAVVIMGSPLEVPSLRFSVDHAELRAITVPKLFITSENDHVVDPQALKDMYGLAVEPKELVVYPGVAHGTEIFATDNGAKLSERLLDFFDENAPPAP